MQQALSTFSCTSVITCVLPCVNTGWRTKCHTGWCTKCHTIDCAHNTFLLLQKNLTSGTELILIGWKIVPNEERVQCDHHFASQPLANEPLHSSQLFDTSLQKARGTTSLCGPWAALHFLASNATWQGKAAVYEQMHSYILTATATYQDSPDTINRCHSFSNLSYDRSKASSKASSPYSAI